MLTFLLDKQGRSRVCQLCLQGPVEEAPLSVQTLRRVKFKSGLLRLATVYQPSIGTASQLASSDRLTRIAMSNTHIPGTSSAQNNGGRSLSLRTFRTCFSRHTTPSRFAHSVRSRTVRPSMAHQPCRSHT